MMMMIFRWCSLSSWTDWCKIVPPPCEQPANCSDTGFCNIDLTLNSKIPSDAVQHCYLSPPRAAVAATTAATLL